MEFPYFSWGELAYIPVFKILIRPFALAPCLQILLIQVDKIQDFTLIFTLHKKKNLLFISNGSVSFACIASSRLKAVLFYFVTCHDSEKTMSNQKAHSSRKKQSYWHHQQDKNILSFGWLIVLGIVKKSV